MDTLECPVCLDTADTPPVYQCPEGHLICKGGLVTLNPSTSATDLLTFSMTSKLSLSTDCNGKMVECPQCGHALMNARNRWVVSGSGSGPHAGCCRTAELLAVKLNQLRGDTVKTVMASQALNITVRNGSQLEGDKIRNMGILMTCILASN